VVTQIQFLQSNFYRREASLHDHLDDLEYIAPLLHPALLAALVTLRGVTTRLQHRHRRGEIVLPANTIFTVTNMIRVTPELAVLVHDQVDAVPTSGENVVL
jgi:hypothetical protein